MEHLKDDLEARSDLASIRNISFILGLLGTFFLCRPGNAMRRCFPYARCLWAKQNSKSTRRWDGIHWDMLFFVRSIIFGFCLTCPRRILYWLFFGQLGTNIYFAVYLLGPVSPNWGNNPVGNCTATDPLCSPTECSVVQKLDEKTCRIESIRIIFCQLGAQAAKV
jgi:hypothetical protein